MKNSNLIAAMLLALAMAAAFHASPLLAGSEEVVDTDESSGTDPEGNPDCDGGAEECQQ